MRYLFVILLFFAGYISNAQLVFIGASSDSVRLGEPIAVDFLIEGIEPEEIQSIEWKGLSAFTCPINNSTEVSMDVELIDFGDFKNKKDLFWIEGDFKFKEEKLLGGWKNTFKIIAWEHYTCPLNGPTITLKNGEEIESFPLNPIPLKSPLKHSISMTLGESPTAIKDTLANLKAPVENVFPYKKGLLDYIALLPIVIAFLFLGYTVYRFFTHKKTDESIVEVTPDIPPLAPHVIALKDLEVIKRERTWEQGEDKAFVSQLTHVIRSYIEGRYDIPALEQTSQEIIQKLKTSQSSEQIDKLKNTLNVSDLIKFAKASATDETYESFVDEAIDWVHSTKPINSEDS